MAQRQARMRARRLASRCCPSICPWRSRLRWRYAYDNRLLSQREQAVDGFTACPLARRVIDKYRDVAVIHEVEDPRHVLFGDVDAAMRAAIERRRVVMRQGRRRAELVAPAGVVNF